MLQLILPRHPTSSPPDSGHWHIPLSTLHPRREYIFRWTHNVHKEARQLIGLGCRQAGRCSSECSVAWTRRFDQACNNNNEFHRTLGGIRRAMSKVVQRCITFIRERHEHLWGGLYRHIRSYRWRSPAKDREGSEQKGQIIGSDKRCVLEGEMLTDDA